jgi:transposase
MLEVIEVLDVSAIENAIQDKDPRGERPYDPRMMLSLLIYGYCTGVFSSRKIERRTYEDVAFRYLAGGEHPEFSTICAFRRTHLRAIDALFVQTVQMSRRAGLVKLGHLSFDGSKVEANASKHKAMSYDRMLKDEARLHGEIRVLLERAERQDEADDDRLGKGVADMDLPAELKRRETRLARIQEARAALEEEARAARVKQLREQAAKARRTARQADDDAERSRALMRAERRETAAHAIESKGGSAASDGGNEADDEGEEPIPVIAELPTHSPQATPEGLPKSKAQRNFTDPESRIMERGGEIVQAYNCQAAVDAEQQIIVAQGLSNQAPDTYYLVPMLSRVEANVGSLPEKISADTGYWAPTNATWCEEQGVDAYIATKREHHSASAPAVAPLEPPTTPQQKMRAKVMNPEGKKVYSRRKCIVEPVFGQIKQAMGFRRFSLRGMEKAKGEWALVCTSHNLRKLWAARRAGRLPALV